MTIKEKPFPSFVENQLEDPFNKAVLTQLLNDDGIEYWIRSGRRPWFSRSQSDGEEFYMIHIPPQEATKESRYQMGVGGLICYVDENDTQGQNCRTILAKVEDGEELIGRARALAQELEWDDRNAFQKFLSYLGQFVGEWSRRTE